MEQFNYFVQTMKLLHLQPEQSRTEMQSLQESVLFLSGLAKHYPKEAKQFSDSLFELLREQGPGLDADVSLNEEKWVKIIGFWLEIVILAVKLGKKG